MKKQEFLKMVQVELDTIKEKASFEEKELLNFYGFDHMSINCCIYGQMTGDCDSSRAIELYQKTFDCGMPISCGRIPFSNQSFNVGDSYTPLEKYLFMVANEDGSKSEKHREIIEYIKGERKTIEL